jgi:hypothetical protein
LKLWLRDGGGVYFSEGDIEGGEGGLFGDCFRVDEKAAVVLGFE